MNIFILDKNPRKAAQYQCDKHVVKMVLESAQIMCTVRNQRGLSSPYRSTHASHPCVKWAASPENYHWLLIHFDELLKEYTRRYGKQHKCAELLSLLRIDSLPAPTEFVQCMPDEYKHTDPVQAYRNYYLGSKSRFAQWNRGTPQPDWWTHK